MGNLVKRIEGLVAEVAPVNNSISTMAAAAIDGMVAIVWMVALRTMEPVAVADQRMTVVDPTDSFTIDSAMDSYHLELCHSVTCPFVIMAYRLSPKCPAERQ